MQGLKRLRKLKTKWGERKFGVSSEKKNEKVRKKVELIYNENMEKENCSKKVDGEIKEEKQRNKIELEGETESRVNGDKVDNWKSTIRSRMETRVKSQQKKCNRKI